MKIEPLKFNPDKQNLSGIHSDFVDVGLKVNEIIEQLNTNTKILVKTIRTLEDVTTKYNKYFSQIAEIIK